MPLDDYASERSIFSFEPICLLENSFFKKKKNSEKVNF
jgi:hypothetical protein